MAFVARDQGSLTVPISGAFNTTQQKGFDSIAECDAIMVEQDVVGEKTMVLNPRDYNNMASGLAQRTLMPRSESALSDINLGPIAGFTTFKTAFGPNLTAVNTGTGYAIDTDQRFVPASQVLTSNVDDPRQLNQDNRFMTLKIKTGDFVVKAGDKFTIADVFAIGHINKETTLQLKTFSVVETTPAATGIQNIVITPPIIVGDGTTDAEDDYANVTAAALNNAALVFLNVNGTLTNIFFINDSIEVFGGRLAFDEDMAGVAVMRQQTDTGIEIIFAKQGSVLTGKATYRLTIFFGVTNLNPEMNGVLIGNQP